MAYTETETLMMEVIENINKRFLFLDVHEYGSFLTPEVINGVIEAMNYNDNYKLIDGFDITPLEYFEGVQMDSAITYYPFNVPLELEQTSVQLPLDFVFTLDNTSIYYYGSVSMSRKLLDIEKLNRSHRYFHSLGFAPFSMKNRDGLNKFNGLFYTKHDYQNKPINPKVALIDDNPNDTNLRVLFGLPAKAPDQIGGSLFTIGSPKNLDNEIHSTIKMFYSLSHDGLIIKPPETGEMLPYYNKVLHYANPHYGYYDNFYDVKPFYGGVYDSETMQPLISGIAYACGFKVVWFTDSEFWITFKYKLVYTDKRPYIPITPDRCCLAQCLGITN